MAKRRRYAENTKVPVVQSRNEIENLLARFGADQFLYGTEPGRAVIGFRMQGRQIRMQLELPIDDAGEVRRLWRSMTLAIKSKLECVTSGIETFEQAFMPYVVMPDGQTVGDWAGPQIEQMYLNGKMPPLLPAPSWD